VDLFAIDDSKNRDPRRDGMGPLVAVGGLRVPGKSVRELELALDALCDEYGFPRDEEFKWSPGREMWERENLRFERREAFNLQALALAREMGAQAIVVMEDITKRTGVEGAKDHEEDVTLMFLERAQECLRRDECAIVVFDRPGGGRRAETDFLAATLTRLRAGTSYSKLDRLAMAVSTDSRLSRLVQLADVLTACSTAYVGGESVYSPKVFKEGVLPLLREDYLVKGGRGLKIHPDFRYGNLYHWLLGDEMFVRYQAGFKLPSTRFTAYRTSPDVA
jgi:hypothetical protein